MEENASIKALREAIDRSRYMVFFGGAGVSTESGIPDFRTPSGLYNQPGAYPPETILSHSFFEKHPEIFFDFYRKKMIHPTAKPNAAHQKLAQLEAKGKLKAIITQNIDGLHAPAQEVLELHGSVHRNHCVRGGRAYALADILASEGVPRCSCGGIIKPDVVLYEEPLDEAVLDRAVCHIQQADLLLIGGTSLNVYPAAGLIRYFQGRDLVIINREPTPADRRASLVIQGSIGEIFAAL